MLKLINTKVLLSGSVILVAAALVIGGAFAFFSDTETSTGNTLVAGALDLKVDSESHYNGSVCTNTGTAQDPLYIWQGGNEYPVGLPCEGTWTETDLGATHKFFNLTDVKPGDEGENTISLHVYNNDAWGRFVISGVQDIDNTCTEPEEESANDTCVQADGDNNTPGSGELAESITFSAWIDDGSIPGFQGPEDVGEGDNVQQGNEQTIIAPGTVDEPGETHNIWEALAAYRAGLGSACNATDSDGNGQTDNDGTPSEDNYLACQGIAVDGRMVGSTTYYFGLDWNILDSVGNEAQTDSLVADLAFEAVQHRNNPGQTF